MHPPALEYVQRIARQKHTGRGDGLEIGSRNVNGSGQGAFRNIDWYGIDVRPGLGVDLLVDAVDYDGQQKYQVVLCTEVLEHAPDPYAVVTSAYRALQPGGLFVMTCAGPDREPHDNDGYTGDFPDYYGAVTFEQMDSWLHELFRTSDVEYHPAEGDLYAWAVK